LAIPRPPIESLEPFHSWGQMITAFFKPDIAVANHGESGESLRGFIGERRLAKSMSVIESGGYLPIQMGHNDSSDLSGQPSSPPKS
jgi:lysophospholipase L1-like esterase